MPYVKRDEFGRIVSVHVERTAEDLEPVASDSPEFLQFIIALGDIIDLREYFDRLDKEFIRVIEDVIYILIEKRLLNLTDLPLPAQRKLAERRNLRGKKGDLGMIIGRGDDMLQL